MKITNVTAKVIGVLGTDLMPDQSMDISAKNAATPSIAVLIKMGLLALDNSAETKKAMEDAAMEKARKQVVDELRAAGKLKEDADEATGEVETPSAEKQTPKEATGEVETPIIEKQAPKRRGRVPKIPEVPAE
jgi:hypothetical protein